MSKANVLGLSHFGLYIKDLEVSKKFYTEILGFEITCETVFEDGTKICFVRKGDCEIEVVQQPVWEDRKDGLFDHLAMKVDDIEAAKADLESKGIVFEHEIKIAKSVYNGVKYTMFRGPDGEHLEFSQPIK